MPHHLLRARTAFLREIDDAADFFSRANSARHQSIERKAFTTAQREWCAEHTLLKLTVGAECFLEQALGAYVIGERAPSGYRPRRIRRINASLPEALRIFRGDRDFVGWITPGQVIKRAEGWLRNGEPFSSALSPVSQVLGYVRLMRNSIAHESESAQDQFLDRTRALYGALAPNTSPGGQLLQPPPAALGALVGRNLLTGITEVYRAVSSAVVP